MSNQTITKWCKIDEHSMKSNETSTTDDWQELERSLEKSLPKGDKEIINVLRRKYLQTNKEFRRSKHCRAAIHECMQRITSHPTRIYMILNDLKTTFKLQSTKGSTKHSKTPSKPHTSTENHLPSIDMDTQPSGSQSPASTLPSTSDCHSEPKVDDDDVVILDLADSTPVLGEPSKPAPSTSSEADPSPTGEALALNASRRANIARLEKLLSRLSQAIRSLEEEELDLDALESVNSSYVQLHGLKRRYLQVWNRLCDAKRVARTSGRIIRRRFTFNGSNFPSINQRIEDLVNRDKKFPDYTDIRRIVSNVNRSEKLDLNPTAVTSLARELFVDVGHKLKRRRQDDFRHDFGCHLTDDLREEDDPTYSDPLLRRQLAYNKHMGESKLDAVFEEFVKRQYSSQPPESVHQSASDSSTASSETLGSHTTVESEHEKAIDLVESTQLVSEPCNESTSQPDVVTLSSDSESEHSVDNTEQKRQSLASPKMAIVPVDEESRSSVITLTDDEEDDEEQNFSHFLPQTVHRQTASYSLGGPSGFFADSLGSFPHLFPPRVPSFSSAPYSSTRPVIRQVSQTVCMTREVNFNGVRMNTAEMSSSNFFCQSFISSGCIPNSSVPTRTPNAPRPTRGRLVPTYPAILPPAQPGSISRPQKSPADTELIVLD